MLTVSYLKILLIHNRVCVLIFTYIIMGILHVLFPYPSFLIFVVVVLSDFLMKIHYSFFFEDILFFNRKF